MARHITRSLIVALGAASLVLGADLAHAEGSALRGWGPTVGISASPDQFTIGGMASFALTSPLGILASADLGFGDDLTTLVLGPSIVASAPLGEVGSVHGGVQLALVYLKYSGDFADELDRLGVDTSNTEFAVALDFGYSYPMQNGNGLVIDAKVALTDDYPDFKATVGYEIKTGN